jgi:filamentous hemagglutinin
VATQSPIYKQNGKYYIFDSENGAKTLTSSPLGGNLAENVARGADFECGALCELGLPKNTQALEVDMGGGVIRTVIPDAMDGKILVEAKDIQYITNFGQLRAYAASDHPVRLIVSSNTERISKPLQDVILKNGGSIEIFDLTTKTFTPWAKKVTG